MVCFYKSNENRNISEYSTYNPTHYYIIYSRISLKTKSNGFKKIKTFHLKSCIRARSVLTENLVSTAKFLWIRDYKFGGQNRKRRVQIVSSGTFIIFTLIISYTPIFDLKWQHTSWRNINTVSVHYIWDPRSVRRF